jgi:antitoxin component YwqK of YwqJK toxin-antitoxin module
MKRLVLLFAALLVAGCGEKEKPLSDAEAERILKGAVHIDDVAKLTRTAAEASSLSKDDDGKVFWDRTGRAYSGWFKGRYESGEVEELMQVKDGWFNGLMTTWHKNGQKKTEETYKGDKGEILHGPYMQWHENGQKEHEGIYKDDKNHGPYTSWHKNGQKAGEATYKDGKRNGPATSWHETGQKEREGTYKDGKKDGLRTRWHENGQKWAEGTYKDGEKISDKYWNSKGEEVDSWTETYD